MRVFFQPSIVLSHICRSWDGTRTLVRMSQPFEIRRGDYRCGRVNIVQNVELCCFFNELYQPTQYYHRALRPDRQTRLLPYRNTHTRSLQREGGHGDQPTKAMEPTRPEQLEWTTMNDWLTLAEVGLNGPCHCTRSEQNGWMEKVSTDGLVFVRWWFNVVSWMNILFCEWTAFLQFTVSYA